MNPQIITSTPDSDSQQPPTTNLASPATQIQPSSTETGIANNVYPQPVAHTQPNTAPAVVVSHHEPLPQTPVKNTRSFSLLKLVLVLLLVLGITGVSGDYAINQINKTQKTFSGSSDTNKWVSYSSSGGNFSASFPTSPTVVPQTNQSQNGVSYTVNGVQSGNSNTAYAVVYITYPSSVTLPTGTTGLSDSVQTEENQLQGGQLVSSNDTTVSGNQAETYEITGSKNGTNVDITGEVVIVNQVLYNAFATQVGSSQAPNAQHFLNSFNIGQ